MAWIPRSSRPCRAAFHAAGVSNPLGSWYDLVAENLVGVNASLRRRCLSSSGEPPSTGHEAQKESRRLNRYSHQEQKGNQSQTSQQRGPKHRNQRDEGRPQRNQYRRKKQDRSPSLVQSSQYAYSVRSAASSLDRNSRSAQGKSSAVAVAVAADGDGDGDGDATSVLRSVNAAALLDPLAYCKGSTKLSVHAKVGGKSISGTDAARRLLRGKREFVEAARGLGTAPVLLEGHGVPPALFQHCVDLGGALLGHYGPETVECSFHNYDDVHPRSNHARKTPSHVRVRRRDGTNACLPPPSASESDRTDWDYNLALYLTVMERIAKCLGPVLEPSPSRDDASAAASPNRTNQSASPRRSRAEIDEDADADALSSPSSSSSFPHAQPRWNVDVLEGAYFDLRPLQETNPTAALESSDDGAAKGRQTSRGVRPFPVVEFLPQYGSRSSGHVLIRLQGCPRPNEEFGGGEGPRDSQRASQKTVTLVFDACFQNATSDLKTRNR